MAEVAAAATFVGAVMETAGYMTQAQFLADFQEFFRYGGALVYTIACIGGVVSIALFGSYRAARYLLVGPVLFWFLIIPTEETRGAVWKLGGGNPRGYEGEVGANESLADVEDTIRGSGAEWRTINADGTGTYRVAWLFDFYVKLINGLVNETIDQILRHEDDEDLLFIGKTRGLEMLMKGDMTDSKYIRIMMDNLILNCEEMVGFMLAASSPDIAPARIAELRAIASAGGHADLARSADLLQSRRDHYTSQFEAERIKNITVGAATKEFMKEQNTKWGAGASQDEHLAAYLWGQAQEQGKEPEVITCGQAWRISTEALEEYARERESQVLKATLGHLDPDNPDYMQLACRKLAEKMGHEFHAAAVGGNCELVPAISVFLIRQFLSNRETTSKMLKRHMDHAQLITPIQRGTPLAWDANGEIWQAAEANGAPILKPVKEYNGLGELETVGYTRLFYREVNVEDPKTGKMVTQREESWRPYVITNEIGNSFDSAFREQQPFQTRFLRQSIFTYAMNLPYYQGVLLYLLAAAYPFFALVVLVPGRAMSFLTMPLAWFWLKTWDIGFAMVMILDRVIWNMFPHTDLPSGSVVVQQLSSEKIPSLLTTAMKADPSYHLHAYYMILSMSLFAIPFITGCATLKAKRSMLASFTQAPRERGRDAGQRAASAYGMGVQGERLMQMYELGGFVGSTALKFSGADNGRGYSTVEEGFKAEGRGESARAWAAVRAGASAAKDTSGWARDVAVFGRGQDKKHTAWERDHDKWIKNGSQGTEPPEPARDRIGLRKHFDKGVETALNTADTYLGTYQKVLGKEVLTTAAQHQVWNPLFGRWGKLQMIGQAYFAGMDGTQGYELMDQTANSIDKQKELWEMKWLDIGMDIFADLGIALGNLSGLSQKEWVRTLPALFGGAAYGTGQGMALYEYLEEVKGKPAEALEMLEAGLKSDKVPQAVREGLSAAIEEFKKGLNSDKGPLGELRHMARYAKDEFSLPEDHFSGSGNT